MGRNEPWTVAYEHHDEPDNNDSSACRDDYEELPVIFIYIRPQCKHYLHTWIPRDASY